MKIFRLLILLILFISCSNNRKEIPDYPVDPYTVIYLQPYDNFSQKEALLLSKEIYKGLNKVYGGDWSNIEVLPNKSLPKKAYYEKRNRYLANELLKDLPNYKGQIYVIGLTHKDISYKIHGSENYGIMGLTPLNHLKSIVSDYRVKGNDFVAVIVHEFGHGFYGANHCKDANCIMCDYQYPKGKPFSFRLCKNHKFMN